MRSRCLTSLALGLLACSSPSATLDLPTAPEQHEVEPRAEPRSARAEASPPERCNAPQYRVASTAPILLEAVDDAPPLVSENDIGISLRGDLDDDGREDVILYLGMCGAWAHCVHAILLGCGGGRFSLASEPDLYAYGFELLPGPDGSPQLWELTRGGSALNDDLGRRRWTIIDGRAQPTDDWQLIQRGP